MTNYYSNTQFRFSYTFSTTAKAAAAVDYFNKVVGVYAYAGEPAEHPDPIIYAYGSASPDELACSYIALCRERDVAGVLCITYSYTTFPMLRSDGGIGGGYIMATVKNGMPIVVSTECIGNLPAIQDGEVIPHTGFVGYNTEKVL